MKILNKIRTISKYAVFGVGIALIVSSVFGSVAFIENGIVVATGTVGVLKAIMAS